jgi:hypothetical protein
MKVKSHLGLSLYLSLREKIMVAMSKAGVEVVWLEGGNTAWAAAGNTLQTGDRQMSVERVDRYRRPYEGTDNAAAAMQAYLDWEFGLVEQLGRDGTHHFRVI